MGTNLRVPVKNQLADLVHRDLVPRPDLGDVKRIEVEFSGSKHRGGQDLDEHRPACVAALFDVLP